jgi:hypothetical protein
VCEIVDQLYVAYISEILLKMGRKGWIISMDITVANKWAINEQLHTSMDITVLL